MAFAVSDDHASRTPFGMRGRNGTALRTLIRRQLRAAHVEADDPRVLFIGFEAYCAAGGNVLRDLFQTEHESYLTDPAVLDRLVTEKLEADAEALRAESWKLVDIGPDLSYGRLHHMRRVYPEREPPTDARDARSSG